MIISFIVAFYFQFMYEGDLLAYEKLVIGVLITTAGWIAVTFLTQPEKDDVLSKFYQQVRPHNAGWKKWLQKSGNIAIAHDRVSSLGLDISAMIIGCLMVYGYLFGLGYWIYGDIFRTLIAFGIAFASTFILLKIWPRLSFS